MSLGDWSKPERIEGETKGVERGEGEGGKSKYPAPVEI
jgi:hypothetical protein